MTGAGGAVKLDGVIDSAWTNHGSDNIIALPT